MGLFKDYNRHFWLLCLSGFLFFASFNMVIPELPAFITSLGGENYKGLIIFLFTLSALVARPISGKLADIIGRVPIMFVGITVAVICGFLYPFVLSVSAFLLLRFFHGFSVGFTPTGTSAYLADIIKPSKRGEALGYFGIATTLGMSFGPALGGFISYHFSLEATFYAACAAALTSGLLLLGLPETLANKEKIKIVHFKIGTNEIFEKRVLAPSFVLCLSVISFGTVLTVIPDFSQHLGLNNKGLFFTSFTAASLVVRLFAGKYSDKHGRIKTLVFSTGLVVLAVTVIAFSTNIFMLMLGSVLYGFATGMNSPTIIAWTVDLSDPKHRGRALATMFIALEAGIGLGALLSAWIRGNNPKMFVYTFLFSAFMASIAFCYLLFLHLKISKIERLRGSTLLLRK